MLICHGENELALRISPEGRVEAQCSGEPLIPASAFGRSTRIFSTGTAVYCRPNFSDRGD